MRTDIRKTAIQSIPYLIIMYLFDKAARLYRFSEGSQAVVKLYHAFLDFGKAFEDPLPSLHPYDLLIGIIGAAAIRIAVYFKGKNAKKYRQGEEYGSARWGTEQDIRPYMDKKPERNIILTATESLTMDGRPKNPKYARNKNVVVIGGSGSGKTRFFVKPQLMQMHSSYCITDPKGKFLLR